MQYYANGQKPLTVKKQELVSQIRAKKSYLCVGLDTDLKKIPAHLHSHANPVLEFNRQIIKATASYTVAYKINTAFYEWMGPKGWEIMEETLKLIPQGIFTIADAKRGDIGNTSAMYARTFFDTMNFDSVTVAPYMGHDSVKPFLEFTDKWTILLGLTSNEGSNDFQHLQSAEKPLYQHVMETAQTWGTPENLMFVVGATRTAQLQHVRQIVPDNFLLVPGVGAQGGSLADVSQHGINGDVGLLVNSSRAVIYASGGEDFAVKAREEAQKVQTEMAAWLQ